MLFYKPESYILPNSTGATPSRMSPQPSHYNTYKADLQPTLGAAGDPSIAPTKFSQILKQKQIEVPNPKFVRDAMRIDDINGTKSRRLIRGMVAKNILSNADIEGSSPKQDKVSFRGLNVFS